MSAVQDDVGAVACRSHHRERSDEHVRPAAVQTLVDLTLERNMKTLHQANVFDFLLEAGAKHEHDWKSERITQQKLRDEEVSREARP